MIERIATSPSTDAASSPVKQDNAGDNAHDAEGSQMGIGEAGKLHEPLFECFRKSDIRDSFHDKYEAENAEKVVEVHGLI